MARKMSKRQSVKQMTLVSDGATALYVRVSTEKQANEGFSLDAQLAELTAYCAAMGWTVADDHVYVDAGVSGKSTDRPAFLAMMDAAKQGRIVRVVATKLDRIARNLKDLLQTVDDLRSVGCALVVKKEQFDTSTAQGVFVLQMLGAVGELERSMIADRMDAGRQQKAATGGYNGSRCPLGYIYANDTFVINPGQAATVQGIFESFVSGQGMSAIANSLNDSGTSTATGGRWYAGTVRYILQNGFYAGLAQWDETEVDGSHPAIISRELYEMAHRRLQAIRPGPVAAE